MSVNSPRSTFEMLGKTSLSLITAAAIFSACSDGENRNADVEDTTPPSVNVIKPFVSGNINSYNVDYNRNCLYLTDSNGNTVDVINRYDRESKIKDVWVSYYDEEGKGISQHTYNYNSRQPSTQYIYNSGKVLVKVGDTAGNVTTSDTVRVRIDKEEPGLMGLERLENLYLEVGKTVNLLEGITYNGESAESLYRNGNVTVTVNGKIVEPLSYTPKAPGQIIIRLEFNKDNRQSKYEITKNVNAAEFAEISLPTLDLNSEFPWLSNLKNSDKYQGTILPLAKICALGKNLGKDTPCYIMGESASSSHGGEGTDNYEALGINNVQYCSDWTEITKPGIYTCSHDEYFNRHSKEDFMDSFSTHKTQHVGLQEKVEKGIVLGSIPNTTQKYNTADNESCENGTNYSLSGINAKTLNPETGEYEANNNIYTKISVTGMPLDGKLTFGINNENQKTACLPIQYGIYDNCYYNNNYVFALPDVLSPRWNDSTSSFPTAEAGALFTYLYNISEEKLKKNGDMATENQDGKIYNDFMKYITQNYFIPIEYDSPIGKGSTVYTLNYDGFINDEILHQSELQRLDYTLNEVELPYYSYFLYTDPSITCNINGKDYASDDNNKKIILDAMENGEDIKWIRHKGTDDGKYKVCVVVNKEGDLNVEGLEATIRTDESWNGSPVYSNNQGELYQNSTHFEKSNIGGGYTPNNSKVGSTLYNALYTPNYENNENAVPLQK